MVYAGNKNSSILSCTFLWVRCVISEIFIFDFGIGLQAQSFQKNPKNIQPFFSNSF